MNLLLSKFLRPHFFGTTNRPKKGKKKVECHWKNLAIQPRDEQFDSIPSVSKANPNCWKTQGFRVLITYDYLKYLKLNPTLLSKHKMIIRSNATKIYMTRDHSLHCGCVETPFFSSCRADQLPLGLGSCFPGFQRCTERTVRRKHKGKETNNEGVKGTLYTVYL